MEVFEFLVNKVLVVLWPALVFAVIVAFLAEMDGARNVKERALLVVILIVIILFVVVAIVVSVYEPTAWFEDDGRPGRAFTRGVFYVVVNIAVAFVALIGLGKLIAGPPKGHKTNGGEHTKT